MMTIAEWHATLFQFISIILGLLTFIGSIIAIYYAYHNLREMKKQLLEQQNQYFEQNRGNIIFYISKSTFGPTHDLIIKNFGNAPAKMLSIKITPALNWEQVGHAEMTELNIANLKNILLAPQQHVSTLYDFTDFKEKLLEIEVCYETCSKTFTETYNVDINYIHKVLTAEPSVKDELTALKSINKSLTSIADKFI